MKFLRKTQIEDPGLDTFPLGHFLQELAASPLKVFFGHILHPSSVMKNPAIQGAELKMMLSIASPISCGFVCVEIIVLLFQIINIIGLQF